MPEPDPATGWRVELVKKLPTLFALVALGWALLVSLRLGIDSAYRLTLVAALAGLGGFHLKEWLDRVAPR